MSSDRLPAEGEPRQETEGRPKRRRTQWVKNRRFWAFVSVAIVALCATAAASYLVGRSYSRHSSLADGASAQQADITTWYCSMHPQITSPKKGKCAICFMDLIPMPEDAGGSLGPRQLSMSPDAVALAKIQTTAVKRQFVAKEVSMTGKVDYDETRLVDSAAWIPGRLDRLHVDYTGVLVRKGKHLFDIYSPDLVVGQDELLLALKAHRESTPKTRDQTLNNLTIAEEKLRLWGMLDEQIEEIKQRGKASDHMTVYSPVSGIVIRKHCNEGAYVKEGTPVYTIADLSLVWVYLDAYESDIAWLRSGQKVEFTTRSYPGEIFKGRIAFIDPMLTGNSRVVKVRVNVSNAGLRLKPGMFVHAIARSPLVAGGRVLDGSLAGKWICPMHPEIVKDGPSGNVVAQDTGNQPGEQPEIVEGQVPNCDICGMDLEPAERHGVVTLGKSLEEPLVIPVTAPLRTGKRAVVYVQVNPLLLRPEEVLDWSGMVSKIIEQASAADPSPGKWILGQLAPALKKKLEDLPSPPVLEPRLKSELLGAINNLLARHDFDDDASWEEIKQDKKVGTLRPELAGKLSDEDIMLRNRRLFEGAFPDQIVAAVPNPIFEGREIVLGPRAGDYYIVRHGLAENERVVTQGNFKIDSALQIKANPSMMNPESLDSAKKGLEISTEFRISLNPVCQAYLAVGEALATDDVPKARQGAEDLLKAIDGVDNRLLDVEARRHWQYAKNQIVFTTYDMLDGRDAADTRRSFAGLSQAMVRLVQGFGHALPEPLRHLRCDMALDHKGADWLQLGSDIANPYFGLVRPHCGEQVASFRSQAPLDVPNAFRRRLAGVYEGYLRLQEALADDRLPDAVAAWQTMRSALDVVDAQGLGDREGRAWQETRQQLTEDLDADLRQAEIDEVRRQFENVSTTMLGMVETFGHVQDVALSKAFCSMAFNNKGAVWLQAGGKIANPYFGHKMLRCGDVKRTFASASGATAMSDPRQEEQP